MVCACCLARLKAGKSSAARMAMMAITTSSSTNVKPPAKNFRELWLADFLRMTDFDQNIVFLVLNRMSRKLN